MHNSFSRAVIIFLFLGTAGCLNPFAPGFDDSADAVNTILGDQRTVEGLFQNFRFSYTFRDTTIYTRLLDRNFIFIYRDFERGLDVSWGKDEDLRTTYGLFQNAQNLDLVWNNIISFSGDSLRSNVTRGFNLTITFSPNFIERVDGYANLSLERNSLEDNWRIIRWRDESNF